MAPLCPRLARHAICQQRPQTIPYLGGVDWRGHEQTKSWYSGLKSRPSFRPMLAERMEVIVPPEHYDKVDF